jgi:hypothetical protein
LLRANVFPGHLRTGFFVVATESIETLDEAGWRARQREHEARVRVWTDPHQARGARGEKHPIHDFLFDYYAFRPARLRRWHPGPDVVLAGGGAREFLRWPEYRETSDGVMIDLDTLSPKRRVFIAWLRDLLVAARDRPAFFGCHGLHEWAMVYRLPPEKIRHGAWPLRFSADELARIVESLPVRCTHFDAFRFFTPAARPLNRTQPSRATVSEHEQRGCLHANMDLYKWAFKLAPVAPSGLIADCFVLARDIRELDMRASPYDFSPLGFAPVKIETPGGRDEYEQHQRLFATRAGPLRARLLALCERLLAG